MTEYTDPQTGRRYTVDAQGQSRWVDELPAQPQPAAPFPGYQQGYQQPTAFARTTTGAGHGIPPKKKPIFLRWWFVGLAGVVLIGILASAFGGGTDDTVTTANDTPSASSSATEPPVSSPAKAPSSKAAETKKPETNAPETKKAAPAPPKLTKSQEQAIRSAENYLSFAPFSRKGLIRQLSSSAGDGFPKADAVYAVDHIDVDWKEQAAKAAQNYLEITSFSRAGLIEQLESDAGDGYTHEEAVYGVKKAGL